MEFSVTPGVEFREGEAEDRKMAGEKVQAFASMTTSSIHPQQFSGSTLLCVHFSGGDCEVLCEA